MPWCLFPFLLISAAIPYSLIIVAAKFTRLLFFVGDFFTGFIQFKKISSKDLFCNGVVDADVGVDVTAAAAAVGVSAVGSNFHPFSTYLNPEGDG